MGQLVDDLLNLARAGRRDLSLQGAGLKSVIEEVVSGLKADFADRQVEWKIGDLPYVECDPGLTKQVFQNLLSNALKFTRPRAQAVIEVEQREEKGETVIYVRDNGVGFSMKYADKLFGVFQRLHRPEDFEGTAWAWPPSSALFRSTAAASGQRPNWTRAQLFISPSELPRKTNSKRKRQK
jgi:light-regulated signal transduction histidine kinase (bacteriophytochrome)